ncbi:MAG: transglutaminase-like cysteine peptidase [Alphaproteobacteria bacterium]
MRRARTVFSARILAGVLVLAGPYCLPGTGAAAEPTPALFGTRETRSDNLKPFQKWLGALERHAEEKLQLEVPCTPSALERCRLRLWKNFLEATARLDRRSQIDAVNRFANQHPYILDSVNWGMEDYWTSPKEMLDRNGDCEDYAILKFISLRLLGLDNDAMRLVVLQDTNLRILHAVLMIFHGEQTLILDNQIPSVVPMERIRHYKPVYSINERHWWLHRP